ncbi:efflux RND transporter periplasmic adaptor subunit [Neisseriaceae bacterium JH1-16]|nr:efflux RND transporter periplasmic adaptor subunit [Neisseriaceae bacterium JH1-16]
MKKTNIVLLVAAVAAGSAGAGYWAGHQQSQASTASVAPAARAQKPQGKVLYWYDPMVPNQHFDKPGKSPFMDMQLVPKYAEKGGDSSSIAIDPSVTQNLGVRLAKVERGVLGNAVSAAATVQFNDRDVAVVQTRAAGFVQRVYALAPGDVIAKGAPLADVLVPDWAGAQEELLAVRGTGDQALIAATRQRLKLLGMPDELITRVERSGRVSTTTTLTAPIAGVIQELGVRAGMTLAAGMTVAKLNGLSSVWLEAAVPEAQTGAIRVGQVAQVSLAAFPDKPRSGKVIAILPEADVNSRTLRVRIELTNRDGTLKPGMFAQIRLAAGSTRPTLLVPSEALIRTGTRTLVITSTGTGHFKPVEVKVGAEAGGKTAIVDGLTEGEQVVASGQFLIDSEASLRGVLQQLESPTSVSGAKPTASSTSPATQLHQGTGKVEKIDGQAITLSHGPIASMGWGAMTMTFKLAKSELAKGLKPGDAVAFGFSQNGGDFVIQQLHKAGGAS